MNPIRQILSNAGIYGLAQGISRGLSLIALPILTRHLSTSDYGVIVLLAVLATSLRVIFGTGILSSLGIVYFRSEDDEYRSAAVWTTLIGIMGSSVLMLALVALCLGPINVLMFDGARNLGPYLLLYAASLALQMSGEPILLRLQFQGWAASFAVYSVTAAIAGLAASLLLVVVFRLGIEGWIIGQLTGSAIFFGSLAAGVLPRLGRLVFDRAKFAALLRAGIPLVPGSVALLLMNQSAPVFMSRMSDLASVGVFGVGYQLGMAMVLATSAFAAAWMPFFQSYMTRPDEASKVFPDVTSAHILGFGAVTVLFFVFSVPVVSLLTPPQFHAAWQVVGPVALAQMLMSLWAMLLPGVYFAAETHFVSLVQMLAAAVSIGFYYLLIPALGPVGGALPLVIGALVMVIIQYGVNIHRAYPVRMAHRVPFLGLLALLISACGAVWGAWHMLGTSVAGFAAAIACLVAFVAAAWLWKPAPLDRLSSTAKK